ncbi:MAG: peptidylprolyl isomerase [Pseudomonadota bacterium]
MQRLIKEPLIHFILIAVATFLVYGWLSHDQDRADRTIVVTEGDLDRMAALFTAEAGTLPSQQDLRAMISDHVEQRALAREAQRLGLAQGDTVVERRLAQKMSFMITDTEAIPDPSESELEYWFNANQALFSEPDRLSFQHVYFSQPDDVRLGQTIQSLAAQPDAWRSKGDPFMLQRAYNDLPPREIARLFGGAFATAVLQHAQTLDQWSGPIESALGTHLIRIKAVREGGLPALEQIRDRVLTRWREEEGRRQARAAIKAVVSKYQVEIEGVPAP